MRGLTAAVVAGGVVVLVAAALYLRSGDTANEPAVAPVRAGSRAGVAGAAKGQPDASSKGMEHSSRVEERLGQLREDFEHRQAGSAKPEPNVRAVPTMSASMRKAMEGKDAPDDGDDEDPEEMAELKHTLLTNPDPDERVGAVLTLTGEEGPESLNLLLEAMGDPDGEVRLAVVEALGDRAEELSPDTIAPALKDPDPEVRFEAVSILGDMETPEATQMLRAACNDPDEDVRALCEGIQDFNDQPGQAQQPQGQPSQQQNGQPKPHQ